MTADSGAAPELAPAAAPSWMTLTYFPAADLLLYENAGGGSVAETRRYHGEAEMAQAAAAARDAAAHLDAASAGIYRILQVRHGWTEAQIEAHAAAAVAGCPQELPVDIQGPASGPNRAIRS